MRHHVFSLFSAAAVYTATALSPVAATELIMVEEHGCMWCAQWNREIADIYPKTPEGQAAPLRRIDIRDATPGDLDFARAPFFTPTFILVGDDGVELDRIEGYPGEDFFWGLLGKMLKENTDFQGAS